MGRPDVRRLHVGVRGFLIHHKEAPVIKFAATYAYFCDDFDLKRIGATAEEHLANLDRMALEILRTRQEYVDQIAARCPHCGK